MAYTEHLINKETEYLIAQINTLFKEHNSPNYVDVKSDLAHLKDDMLIKVDFDYVLIEPTKETVILTTSARVDPEYFFVNETDIIKELNSSFFIEILRHTEFDTKPLPPNPNN